MDQNRTGYIFSNAKGNTVDESGRLKQMDGQILFTSEDASNKAGYTAQDAPSMRTDRRMDRRTDGHTLL